MPHDEHVRGRRRGRKIDGVRHPAGFLVRTDDTRGFSGDGVLRLLGRGADVMGADHVRQLRQRIAELTGGPGRLVREDVESHANPAVFHRVGERRVVHHFRASRVDEVRAGLQPIENRGADEIPRLPGQREVNAEHVGPLCDLAGRIEDSHAGIGDSGSGTRFEAAAPNDNRHAERVRAMGDLPADASVADDAQCSAEKSSGLRIFFLVPLSRAEVGYVVSDAAVEGEDQREGQLRYGDRVFSRAVGDVNAVPRCGVDVDRVDTRACADDQRKRCARQHPFRYFRAANDEDVCMGGGQRGGKLLVGERGLVDHFASGGLDAVDANLLELIGD